MMKRFFTAMACTLVCFLAACDTFVGNGSADGGTFQADQITVANDIITFDASTGDAVYHAIDFKNKSDEPVTLVSLIFSGNNCADFTLYNITSQVTGSVLLNSNDPIDLDLGAGQAVDINIRYKNTPSCSYSDYQTTLYIYYVQGSHTYNTTVVLQPTGASGGHAFACDDIDDNSSLYSEVSVDGKPTNNSFYLRIDRMRGYMYVPKSNGGVTGATATMGTDVNGLTEEDFIKPFIAASISSDDITLSQLTDKNDFCLPSPEDNQFFGDASALLTSAGDLVGTIDSAGNIEIKDVKVTILADHIPGGLTFSIAVDKEFKISIITTLTTKSIPSADDTTLSIDAGLQEATGQADDNGDSLLPISQDDNDLYYLEGSPISSGKITLVGIGSFTNEDNDFIGTQTASDFLFDDSQPAYLYILLDASVVEKTGTEE